MKDPTQQVLAKRVSRRIPRPRGPATWSTLQSRPPGVYAAELALDHDFFTIITTTETNGERVAITQILIDPRLLSNTKPS
jgi:hypothetical protein